MLIANDCLLALPDIQKSSIDLAYLDPPFFSQKTHKLSARDSGKSYEFNDSWESIQSYSAYIKIRLEAVRRVLKSDGSIFLHCDRNASHHLRLALDEVFGCENFQSEIIWSYRRWSNTRVGLLNSHQTIFFYSKSSNFKFNQQFTDYSPTTNIDQIFQMRKRDKQGKSIYKKDDEGRNIIMSDKKGVPLSDVWEIPYLNPKAKERAGFPTQKPILLLQRIIELTTNPGDIVLDPFCGSGTTLVAAKLLNRKFIGIDINQDAISLSEKRLKNPVKSDSALLENGKASYLNQDVEIIGLLMKIGGIPVQRNKGIDGFLKLDDKIHPIPIRFVKIHESISEAKDKLLKACVKNDFKMKVLVAQNALQKHDFYHKDNIFIVNRQTILESIRKLKRQIRVQSAQAESLRA